MQGSQNLVVGTKKCDLNPELPVLVSVARQSRLDKSVLTVTGFMELITVSVIFLRCSVFRQLWVFVSLLSNIFIDDFSARQYKNCVRILKGSYIVMKCSDNKV